MADLEFDKGSQQSSSSSGGVTVGTTTSDGTSNAYLKTNATGKVVSGNITDGAGVANIGSASDATTTVNITNTGASGALISNFNGLTVGHPTAVYFGDSDDFPLWAKISPNGLQLGSSQDAGIARVADSVIRVGNTNDAALGWIQTAGGTRVASPVTNATATKAAITGLSSTVAAGRKYAGTITLIAKNSTAAEGLQFDFNGGSATFTNIQFGFQATPPGVTLGTVISSAAGTSLTATTATTTDVVYTIYFTCVINAAGTIIPQVAEVSHTSGTATVELGSSMILNDIP